MKLKIIEIFKDLELSERGKVDMKVNGKMNGFLKN